MAYKLLKFGLTIIGILLTVANLNPVQAEAVQLITGKDSFGQGWLFLDFDGVCKVVTAGHVVRGLDGSINHPLIRTQRAQEATTGSVIVMSADPDIAVLAIPDTNLCGTGRLSGIGIERRIQDRVRLDVWRIDSKAGEVKPVPTELVASSIDEAGGRMFAVKPTESDSRVVQGWSGSPIVDEKGLLGIIVEAGQGNTALAVRADVVREMLDRSVRIALPTDREKEIAAEISVSIGTSDDPQHGPDQSLKLDGTGWNVSPRRGVIELTLSYKHPIQIHGATIIYDKDGVSQITGLTVSTTFSPSGDDWIEVNSCRRPPNNSGTVTCATLPRTVTRTRLSLKVNGTAPITIRKIVLQ